MHPFNRLYPTLAAATTQFLVPATTRVRINSRLHHQAVNRLANGFHVAASDEDGIIQAIYSERHPFLLGVQWYPGYLLQVRSHRHIVTALVQAAKQGLKAS